MSCVPKHQCPTLEEDLQTPTEAQGLVGAQETTAEEEDFSSSRVNFFPSSCSLSFSLSFSFDVPVSPLSPCSSSSFHFSYPSSSSSSPMTLGTQDEEEVPPAVVSCSPQSPQTSLSSSLSTYEDSSIPEEEEGPSTSQGFIGTDTLPSSLLEEKVTELAELFLIRYQTKQPITEAEILKVVLQKFENQFAVIFKKACEHLEMVFGIRVKEVDPTIHSYVPVSFLDITYDEIVISGQGMRPNGLLIIILGVIFLEGNHIDEEDIWEVLDIMGLHVGSNHVIYGEPVQFVTEWVKKQYLEYRQVPYSDPACYEFLWGRRAHAETSKMKVLVFMAKLNGVDPSSFSPQYEEALRDEEERA